MHKVYQTIFSPTKGDCQRAAIASLFELKLEDVPKFQEAKDFWGACISFIKQKGYEFDGWLYNHKLYPDMVGKCTDLDTLSLLPSIKEFYCASVISPTYYDKDKPIKEQVFHAVIIDKDCNIIFDTVEKYKGIKQYPLHEAIGFNGVADVMIIKEIC